MELTAEQLEKDENALRDEIVIYARNAQAEINAIQQALQNKMREAQKHVDNLEGKLEFIQKLRADASPKTDGSEQEGPKAKDLSKAALPETGKEPRPDKPVPAP
jgi:hypothetical protein